MFLTETGCWMSPKSPGSKTTPSIRNIRTGGLPSWTTSRPPLSLTSPSCVAFSFRGGAKKESTGPSSSSFTGKGLMSIARHPTLWWTFRIEFSLVSLLHTGYRRSAKRCVPDVPSGSEAVRSPYPKSRCLSAPPTRANSRAKSKSRSPDRAMTIWIWAGSSIQV